jgi:hypothetical protein
MMMQPLRHCEPTVRALRGPMTGSAKQISFLRRLDWIVACAPRNHGQPNQLELIQAQPWRKTKPARNAGGFRSRGNSEEDYSIST